MFYRKNEEPRISNLEMILQTPNCLYQNNTEYKGAVTGPELIWAYFILL